MQKLVALIAGLFAPASVSSVMSSFTKTIDKLDKVAERNMALIDAKCAKIDALSNEIALHDSEVTAAEKTAARLRAIVS